VVSRAVLGPGMIRTREHRVSRSDHKVQKSNSALTVSLAPGGSPEANRGSDEELVGDLHIRLCPLAADQPKTFQAEDHQGTNKKQKLQGKHPCYEALKLGS
jgi:hypothetical protein